MRRRRVILFDDDPFVLDALSHLFEDRGYDVIACREAVACAVYEASPSCDRERPCADIMITDLQMPGMNGIQLFETQARRGCPLTFMNKAVLSGSLDAAALEAIRRLGCASFRKPTRPAQLREWILECEFRMDLSRPLGVLRKESREACTDLHVTVGLEGGEYRAEVLNRSHSGRCLRIGREVAVAQMLAVRTPPAAPTERFEVRWTKPEVTGTFLAGASCV
jgi:CheY-like chemotaxis protein